MKDEEKTKEQLIQELKILRKQAEEEKKAFSISKQMKDPMRKNEKGRRSVLVGEEAAWRLEAELMEAQRLAHVGSWYWDAKTDATTGSDELLRLYGFDPATQSMPDFRKQRGRCYPVGDWERVNAAVQRSLETGGGYELDVQALRNGVPTWITTRGEVVRDAEGRIVGMRGTVQDITERRQAEEEIRVSAAELEAVFAAQGDVVLLNDTEMNVKRANQTFRTIYGFDPVGLNVRDVIRRVSCRRLDGQPLVFEDQPTPMALRGIHVSGAAFLVTRADGTEAVVETSSGPMYVGDRLAGSVTVWHDITGLKQAEAELKSKTQTLEELNMSLKVMLQQREQDRRDMEERFVANIRGMILPYAEKMKSTRLDARQLSYLAVMETHLGEIMSPLLKNLHQYSLTPTEIRVASYIKEGRTTKEIAEIMGTAPSSIDTHRKRIRKKLGLSREKNLQSRIQSLAT